MTHELKIWPNWFNAILKGEKYFEIRKYDRPFSAGDIVVLKEWDQLNQKFTGRKYWAMIGTVFTTLPGLMYGYCIFDLTHGSRIQKRKYDKLYRLNHTALRNKTRQNNYKKTRPAVRKNVPWTNFEEAYLLEHDNKTDKELSKLFKRSAQAISQRRYLLKKEASKC